MPLSPFFFSPSSSILLWDAGMMAGALAAILG